MKRPAVALGLALFALGACGPLDTATRNTPAAETLIAAPAKESPRAAPVYHVVGLRVDVPDSLVVSEANNYLPNADIVWRGDAFGDRHQQIRALFEEAFQSADLGEGQPVLVSIKVTRFHALTEKARYVTGGNYAIHFMLQLTDPKTGALVAETRLVKINQLVAGGYKTMLDDHKGRTEHLQVVGFIRARIEKELGHAGTL
jgi:hypothetical protein